MDALESCINVPYKICYGYFDWNKNTNMLRVKDWSELYKMINNIKDIIENNKLIEENKERDGEKIWEF